MTTTQHNAHLDTVYGAYTDEDDVTHPFIVNQLTATTWEATVGSITRQGASMPDALRAAFGAYWAMREQPFLPVAVPVTEVVQ